MIKRTHTKMYDRPKTELVIAGFVFWFLCYIFVPFGIVLFTVGLNESTPVTRAWLETGYHIVNSILAVCVMRRYLVDSFYNVQTNRKSFAKTVLFSSLLMIAAGACGSAILSFSGLHGAAFHAYPVVDQNVFLLTGTTIDTLPLPSLVCMTLFAPLSVCCLFYAIGFAPAACRHPLLGCIAITLLFAVFHAYEYVWHLDFPEALCIFLLRMPVHLIACHAYRKTDSLWAALFSLGIFNLTATAACIIM